MSEVIRKALEATHEFEQQIELLRRMSPRYPRVLKVEVPGQVFYTTLLRMKQNDQWRLRHFVEAYRVSSGSEVEEGVPERCLERIHIMVYSSIIFGHYHEERPDPLDTDQRDETLRLSSEPL